MDESKRFTLLVAQGGEYETEYDGRMYTYCKFCEACLSERDRHDPDCEMLEARKELGEEWEEYLREVQEEEIKQNLEMFFERPPRSERINCPTCNKVVAECGLAQHQLSSVKCNETRTGFKCILPDNPLTHNEEKGKMRHCTNCGKGMPNAHPNKKFCSNTGRGNCKDRYHNRLNPRSGFHSEYNDSDDDPSWDAHKHY